MNMHCKPFFPQKINLHQKCCIDTIKSGQICPMQKTCKCCSENENRSFTLFFIYVQCNKREEVTMLTVSFYKGQGFNDAFGFCGKCNACSRCNSTMQNEMVWSW